MYNGDGSGRRRERSRASNVLGVWIQRVKVRNETGPRVAGAAGEGSSDIEFGWWEGDASVSGAVVAEGRCRRDAQSGCANSRDAYRLASSHDYEKLRAPAPSQEHKGKRASPTHSAAGLRLDEGARRYVSKCRSAARSEISCIDVRRVFEGLALQLSGGDPAVRFRAPRSA